MAGWITFIIIVVLIGLGVLEARAQTRNRENGRKRIELRMKQIGADRYFPVGSVVAGLAGANRVHVLCAPAPNDLVFMPDLTNGKNPGNPEFPVNELGRIPRDAVDSLAVRDLTQTQKHVQTVQRLSVTRMALLGPLSLAAPKRKKITSTTEIPKFYLAIDWTDPNGIGQETIFEFTKGDVANKAESEVRRALKLKGSGAPQPIAPTPITQPEAHTLRPDEKKCPMCAEIIKTEAIKCRYCGSDLPVASDDAARRDLTSQLHRDIGAYKQHRELEAMGTKKEAEIQEWRDLPPESVVELPVEPVSPLRSMRAEVRKSLDAQKAAGIPLLGRTVPSPFGPSARRARRAARKASEGEEH